MERIIFDNGAGGCGIIIPSEGHVKALLEERGAKGKRVHAGRAACLKAVAARDVPAGASYRIVDVSEIPSDRLFRDAWVDNGTAVVADMPRAKEIAHTHRRAKRAADFAPLDKIIARQIPGQDHAGAEVARQAIRDSDAGVQSSLDSAGTETDLRGIMASAGLLN